MRERDKLFEGVAFECAPRGDMSWINMFVLGK